MLHEHAGARTVGAVRIAVFAMCLVMVWQLPFTEFGTMVDFAPVGVLRMVPLAAWEIILAEPALQVLQFSTCALLICCLLGLQPYRPIALATCVFLTLSAGLLECYGSLLHSRLGVMYAAYVLAVFPAADRLSIPLGRPRELKSPAWYRAPLFGITLVLCTAYALVGLRRLNTSGLGIFFDDTIIHLIVLRAMQTQIAGGAAFGHIVLEQPLLLWLMRIGFPIITAFEILSPVCMFNAWFRRIWLVVMIPFHITVGLLMGIWFLQNAVLIVIFLVDWQGLWQWWRTTEQSQRAKTIMQYWVHLPRSEISHG